uniref:Uncharacterized protein n=1 Tax=Ditylenchus dipsaci TaxID=166011 RepID=A0A915CS84_9BILA
MMNDWQCVSCGYLHSPMRPICYCGVNRPLVDILPEVSSSDISSPCSAVSLIQSTSTSHTILSAPHILSNRSESQLVPRNKTECALKSLAYKRFIVLENPDRAEIAVMQDAYEKLGSGTSPCGKKTWQEIKSLTNKRDRGDYRKRKDGNYCLLTARSDGKKLMPYVLLKRKRPVPAIVS